MKKLLLILAIGAFVACNDNAGTEDDVDDTIAPVTADTTTLMDTTNRGIDTTTVNPADTTVRK